MRPIDAKYPVNQAFGGYATRGVIGRLNGSEIEYLVALYGDYQHYGHAGADIACPIGTPVYAMLDGVVVYAGWGEDLPGDESWGPTGYFRRWGLYKNFPGIVTVIQHDRKFSIYGHLSSNDEAPVGTRVRAGQVIGKSGNTKTRTEYVGPHLHVAMLVDPIRYSTGSGLIFGCADPVPYFGVGSLQSMSATSQPNHTPEHQWITDVFGEGAI
ncbi:M23 family metallopeptidase [Pseudarthrobacter sp. NamE5]|uniref:M23 family metallopeptidase n=1 Tax=Pseudarthrobacter sp. NamE5 TaxID=2576839 RepID=UPI0014864FA5|nr:M23 family metallopeptidase [Pseudarthrobacter sp. NamE5]